MELQMGDMDGSRGYGWDGGYEWEVGDMDGVVDMDGSGGI